MHRFLFCHAGQHISRTIRQSASSTARPSPLISSRQPHHPATLQLSPEPAPYTQQARISLFRSFPLGRHGSFRHDHLSPGRLLLLLPGSRHRRLHNRGLRLLQLFWSVSALNCHFNLSHFHLTTNPSHNQLATKPSRQPPTNLPTQASRAKSKRATTATSTTTSA
jgi:hypothetical protein